VAWPVIVDRHGREYERKPVGFHGQTPERETKPDPKDVKELVSVHGTTITYDPYWDHHYPNI